MSGIDLESLLLAVEEGSPCGEDLEYDPAFTELVTLAQGTPQREMGDQVIPGEEPNWREVRDRCLGLFGRTKDLRVAFYLIAALLETDGLAGLRDGLALLDGLLEQHWDQLHPRLDPDDNNDPTQRVNIIDALSKPPHTDGDVLKFQQRLRETPLCDSRQMGRFALRDILVASGDLQPPAGSDEGVPDTAGIDAAFMDTELELLQANAQAIEGSAELVKKIESGLTERLGAGVAPNLSGFAGVLGEVQKVVAGYLIQRGVGVEGEAAAEGGDAGGGGQAIAGEVRTREDVIRVLDKACDYYRRHEPSSPIPLLLQRAKRLVPKDFMEIMRDLSPDAITQIEVISGVDNES